MASLFGRLFGRRQAIGEVQGILVHWLDTTPVESSDVPCTLRSLDVQAHVAGLYAEVTQTIEIENPNKRPLSVQVAIPLPDRAVISGYALQIDGQMVDGVVVPKQEARVAFEAEQRRGADPGLVEAVRGNAYRTRVYPVPAAGTRSVRLRYVTPLAIAPDGSATLELPMPPEQLAHRSVRIDVALLDAPRPVVTGLGEAALSELEGCWSLQAEDRDVEPGGPVCVSLPQLPASFAQLERDAEGTVWFAASERIEAREAAPADPLTSLTVLWDASGSRADQDHAPELELLRSYCSDGHLKALRLVTFADAVREVRECASAEELISRVEAVDYDGGTSMAALAEALADVRGACVLFSDGVDTLSGEALAAPAACTVLALVSGSEHDLEGLRQACRGRAFDLEHAPQDAQALARAFAEDAPNRLLHVRGEGIADLCDAGVAGSGRRSVIGRLAVPATRISLGANGPSFDLDASAVREGSLLGTAWAARRVAQLSPRAAQNADELLALGRRFGVVSPATSLLVLETLDQWLRYDIEPPATLADMHAAWKHAKQGEMRLDSKAARAERHRGRLAGEWANLLRWWERDYELVERQRREEERRLAERWAQQRTEGAGFCPRCGSVLAPGAEFCYRCGAHVADGRSMPSGASMSAASVPTGLGDTGSFAPLSPSPAAMPLGAPVPGGATMPLGADAPRPAALRESAPRMRRAAAPEEAFDVDGAASAGSVGAGRPIFMGRRVAADMAMDAEADDAMVDEVPTGLGNAGAARVQVRAWMSEAPYLKELDEALDRGMESAHRAYFDQRKRYATSPSFFVDCASWFVEHDDKDFGVRVLTNLAELRIDEAALLRVLGWRLREFGRLEQALVILRRVLALRSEDSQSHRDVALVLAELARAAHAAGDEESARVRAREAGEHYATIALTPWDRRPMAVGLFAVEEYNVLRAWADSVAWQNVPELPSLGEDLEGVLACDLRITLAWDADETDVDLHVTEPSGEEAYYAHQRTRMGGRVSEDITDGYGPELYEIRRAQQGTYAIRAHYYASHQQTVFGPATCTLTVYTDWGRPTQTQQVTTTRLDQERGMVPVGTASYGESAAEEHDGDAESAPAVSLVRRGMSMAEAVELLGEPDEREAEGEREVLAWELSGGRMRAVVFVDGVVTQVLERMPWGEEMIVSQ